MSANTLTHSGTTVTFLGGPWHGREVEFNLTPPNVYIVVEDDRRWDYRFGSAIISMTAGRSQWHKTLYMMVNGELNESEIVATLKAKL